MLAASCIKSRSGKPWKSGSVRISSNIGGGLALDRHQLVPAGGGVVMVLEIVGRFANEKETKPADLPGGRVIAHVGSGVLTWVERATVVANDHAQQASAVHTLQLYHARRILR